MEYLYKEDKEKDLKVYELTEKETAEIAGDLDMIELFKIERLIEPLENMHDLIKEIQRILYRYRNLKHPQSNHTFYNSTNHYARVIRDLLKELDMYQYYGRAFDSTLEGNNKHVRFDIQKALRKIDNYSFVIEPLSMEPRFINELGGDAETIKQLNLKLFDLSQRISDELFLKNYFIEKKEDKLEADLNELLIFPDSDLVPDLALFNEGIFVAEKIEK